MATLNKTEAFAKLRQLGVPGGEPFDLEEELTKVLIDALEERYNYPVDASYALYLANDLKAMAVRIAKLATSMKEIADDE